MAAAVPIDAEQDNSEPLKYKTWVLKVSIHCEGCKRKVKRILHSVEGVYTIDVDAKQHKVVVTGNVDANTLIRKLEKSGKHAELWLDFHKVNNKNQTYEQHPQPQQQQQDEGTQNQNQNPDIENQKVTFNVEEPQKTNNESQKVAENSRQPQQQQVKEVRFEGNIAGEPQKPPENNPGGGGAPDGGGGAKKKKKKKKGQNGNNTANNNPNGGNNSNNNNGEVAGVMEQGINGGPANTESKPQPTQHPNPNPNSNPAHMTPPHNPPNSRVYEHPPPYYAPPPVYAVSYNAAYPSSTYSTSYYSAPPPYSYAYLHLGGDVEAPSPLDWNPHAVPPSDSFEMFSDENPNACAVM